MTLSIEYDETIQTKNIPALGFDPRSSELCAMPVLSISSDEPDIY